MKQLFIFIFFANILLAEEIYTNALANETSPYLQQHADNPVHWYPWGKEAFAKAKKEKKMIFLSIGYSTCHWCHVMEEESFVDENISRILNRYFVNIKVDKEVYPQIDKKYQTLYYKYYKKRGGWPLSVFMNPEASVIHLATYMPKDEGYGSMSIVNILSRLIELQKQDVLKQEVNRHKGVSVKDGGKTKEQNILETLTSLEQKFDAKNGGFAKRPKYPEASRVELLLDIYQLLDEEDDNLSKKALTMATKTLDKMAKSGIYDQIGGGFFRYTTDGAWQMPHFEKMLYTNAELIAVYAKAYVLTKKPLYKRVVKETIEEIERDFMKDDVYISASDADSNDEEGGYFIYSYVEVKEALLLEGLTLKEVEDGLAYLGIEEDGNIDGENSLCHITSKYLPSALQKIKRYLKRLRKARHFPFVDKKINSAWNAMMIKALFNASSIDKSYLFLATKRLDALLKMLRVDGVLYHQVLLSHKPRQKALLEDYAFLIDALLTGYEYSYNKKYLHLAKTLTLEAIDKFYKNGTWYLSDDRLDVKADYDDRYYTSALSVILWSMFGLSSLLEDLSYFENATKYLQKNPANTTNINSSKFRQTLLRWQRGDIIIKADKSRLSRAREKIDMLSYPFVLTKVDNIDNALACRVKSCFAYDKDIEGLLKKIKQNIGKTKSFADKIISTAKSRLHSPYLYGKTGPDSFDCSGFVYYVFNKQGIKLKRTSIEQSKDGKKLTKSDLQKADILFFDTSGRGNVNHSGIYLGDNLFIHASSGKAKSVTISSLNAWYKDKFKWGIRKTKKEKNVNDK